MKIHSYQILKRTYFFLNIVNNSAYLHLQNNKATQSLEIHNVTKKQIVTQLSHDHILILSLCNEIINNNRYYWI